MIGTPDRGAQLPAELEAVDVGEAEVEEDHVGHRGVEGPAGVGAALGVLDG